MNSRTYPLKIFAFLAFFTGGAFFSLAYAQYNGGPVGIEALAATLNEETDTIEDVIEPYLLKAGFLRRTSRGRELTSMAVDHLSALKGDKQSLG